MNTTMHENNVLKITLKIIPVYGNNNIVSVKKLNSKTIKSDLNHVAKVITTE